MDREEFEQRLEQAFKGHPVVAILGPRQCGKTTLATLFRRHREAKKEFHYFDLENPTDLSRLENPLLSLQELNGVIVIDEIQRHPELFTVLRVLVDQKKRRRFLILGSASGELIRQSSESLAGRIRYLELTPFSLSEAHNAKRLWIRGGFPRSYLARSSQESMEWRKAYIATFLERDIPNLGLKIAPASLRRFWMMLAHYHGGIFNASELGRSLGVAHTTVRHYLDILTGTFMMRELPPWFENIGKRQVKSPKVYFRDSGIFHALLGIEDDRALMAHPKIGASWEGFALEEILRHHAAEPGEVYYWATHGHAELDLLLIKDGKRLGFEFKYSDKPQLTSSMQQALDLLHLDQLRLIFPGKDDFPLADNVRAVGLETYLHEN